MSIIKTNFESNPNIKLDIKAQNTQNDPKISQNQNKNRKVFVNKSW